MNILFELNHPAHVHLFKHAIKQLQAAGHNVTVAAKDIPILKHLLQYEGIDYLLVGPKGKGLAGKMAWQLVYLWKLYCLHRRKQFSLGAGISVTLPLLGRITSMKSIVADDDDKAATPLFALLAHRNVHVLLRPAALKHEGSYPNTVYYPGSHELAYLHPSVFEPDVSVLEEQGLMPRQPFFMVRLVAFAAHHDGGKKGISPGMLDRIVQTLQPHGRIVLTHEIPGQSIPGTETLRINPARIHHLMAFARMVISDGQTMCSEAACLGIPSVRISDFAGRISTLEQLEKKWKLSFGFRPVAAEQAIEKIQELLTIAPHEFRSRRDAMVKESLRLTDLFVWLIEHWPDSFSELKKNPESLHRFI